MRHFAVCSFGWEGLGSGRLPPKGLRVKRAALPKTAEKVALAKSFSFFNVEQLESILPLSFVLH